MMFILALDLGTRKTGFAEGPAGDIARCRSGSVRLRKGDAPMEAAAANLGCFLRDRFVLRKPDLICVEHYLNPAAQKHADAAIGGLLLAGALRAIAGCYGIRVEAPYDSTIRKHFAGKGRAGDRTSSNDMVLKRAIVLGYLPRDCKDWDRANAVACFDYASAHYARKAPAALVLFAERAA
jgi:hypothetical protein